MQNFKKTPMIISSEQEDEHERAKTCYVCGGGFSSDNDK